MPGHTNHGVGFVCRVLLVASAVGAAFSINAADQIDSISITGRNSVVIHFPTRANRTYLLQSINHLSCTPNTLGCNAQGYPTNWSNVYTASALPFAFYYHIIDDRSAPRQFYRLRVSAP